MSGYIPPVDEGGDDIGEDESSGDLGVPPGGGIG